MKTGFSTFILGAALGAGIALLYAPMSGEEARNMIRQRSMEVRNNADAFSKQAMRTASELKEVGRQTLDEQKASLEKGARRAKETIQSEANPELPVKGSVSEM